jgi:V/A-type H+-transporting ATPase subunit E
MAEELKHLIDRIKQEGLEKAEAEAEAVKAAAQEEAARIVREAELKRDEILKQAKKGAEEYTERSTVTLEQAARDLLITIGLGIENIFNELVAEAVEEKLRGEVLEEMLGKLAEKAFAENSASDLALVVSSEDKERVTAFFAERYKERMQDGLEIQDDKDILRGFRVAFRDQNVYLDFTAEAVAKSIAKLLRPHLADIVRHSAHVKAGLEEVCSEIQNRRQGKGSGA